MNERDAEQRADYWLEMLIKNQPALFGAAVPNQHTGKHLGEAICALRDALIEGLKKPS